MCRFPSENCGMFLSEWSGSFPNRNAFTSFWAQFSLFSSSVERPGRINVSSSQLKDAMNFCPPGLLQMTSVGVLQMA